ncbi:cytoskeletal protein binding protein [Tulasnella sp. 403]|nr:cytoskeletal protein binding protein [Tulasnella sp. 403]
MRPLCLCSTHTRGQSKELPGRPNTDRPKPTNTRIWHDRSGQFRVEAEYLGLHNGKVRLHKSNGVIIEVPEEKMSAEDMEYIRRAASRNTTLSSSSSSSSRPAAAKSPPSKDNDDDNIPLGEIQRRPTSVSAPKPKAPPRQPRIDWFEFFLSAGCEIDDCTRYSSSFERDRMDESVLPDIKPDTLRALGLREGDVLRVMKKIEQGGWKSQASKSNDPKVQEQVRKDAELAARLQEQEYTGQPPPNRSSTTSPGLFTGPGGALRNNTRRGRPPPTKSATLGVDSISIANASEQLSRTSTPSISAASTTTTTTATTNTGAATGARTSTASSAAPAGGFDDDAWTPRPASAAGKPSTPAPPARAGSVPAVAPAPPPPPPPPAQPVTAPLTAAPAPAPPPVVASPPISSPPTIQLPATQQPTGGAITRPATSNPPGSTLPNEFDVLAKIGSMRAPSAPVPPTTTVSPPIAPPPPVSYQNGLGMGGGASMGTFLTAQQTGALSPLQPASGPRAPFAPVPANERLLQPLIPTNTGFNSFPTGFGPGGYGSQFGASNPGANFLNAVQAQPTGMFNSTPSFNPPSSTTENHSPANVFAAMKAGSFANAAAPQNADKYDALRPQPTGWSSLQPQPTGFQGMLQPGMQPQPTGFQPGFGTGFGQQPPPGFQGGYGFGR